MALTRKMLSAMDIDADKITQIIDGHSETVSALQDEIEKAKNELEKYKKEVERIPNLEKELEIAKKENETAKDSSKKYNDLKLQFDTYKQEQEQKEVDNKKTTVFKELLKDMSVSDNGIKQILKWQGVKDVELDNDNKISNAKELRKAIKEDWADYINVTNIEGVQSTTPPSNTGTGMTKDDILQISDLGEMQKAIVDNHELFGI